MKKICIIGAGLVGRAWSIVFAKKYDEVVLYDTDQKAIENSILMLSLSIQEFYKSGLIQIDPNQIIKKISGTNNISKAVDGVEYIQECGPENLEVKKDIFNKLDKLVSQDVPIGSSTSGIKASLFSEGLDYPERCLVAHPVNPPSLIPLVEIVPSHLTDKNITEWVFISFPI